MKAKQILMLGPVRFFRTAIAASLIGSMMSPTRAFAASSEAPVVRGPAVTQEQLEAFSEAQGISTLADQLDSARPGDESALKLRRLVERAQTAWLAGSVDSARAAFREIARLALDADWREPQREAIHYAMLRLAQSSPTPTEKEEWMDRAVKTFPDLSVDPDLFSPPLVETFRVARTRLLRQARTYMPFDHFPEYRYLLINGKKFVLTPDLKIRLPESTYRVTALSDAQAPVSEKLSSNQLEVFRVSTSRIASGTCEQPSGADSVPGAPTISVLYTLDCERTRGPSGWQPALKGSLEGELSLQPQRNSGEGSFPFASEPPAASSSKRTWLWVGLSAIAIGTAAVLYRESHKPGPAREVVEPTSHQGFK